MNSVKNKKVAIIGGGLGGLTLARLLQIKKVEVKVYERDVNSEVRVQGATLDLHEESGLNALEKAGLMEAFKANYRPGADHLRVTDKTGAILFDDSIDNDEVSRPEIDRGPLRKILLDSLQADTVEWDRHLIALHPFGEGWKIEFKNNTTAYADIVIAADGANSKVRPLVTPIRPFYSGVTIVEGTVYDSAKRSPQIHKMLNGGKIFALGDEKSLIVSSKGDGSLVFYTGCKTDEHWIRTSGVDFTDKQQALAWFQKEFAGWDDIWQELFDQVNLPLVVRPQYCMPLDQSWTTKANLTMLGDAAHVMPPYAGEGVNMAMLDALELSNCLLSDEYTTTQSAIAQYEKLMSDRFKEIGRITLQQTASLHSADAIKNLLALFTGTDH